MERELAGKFTLDEKAKWFNISLVVLSIALGAVLIVIQELLGLGPKNLGVGPVALASLISLVGVVIIHEGLHGLLFVIFGGKVYFGLKITKIGPVAYASSPDTYPRLSFQLVALAPQILTIVLIALLWILSSPILIYAFLLSIICNLAGGFMDFYTVCWLRKFSRSCLVKDTLGGVEVYK
jgi:hypothetical protein